jgi:hypothetical protein
MNKKTRRRSNKNIKKVIDCGVLTMEQQEHHEGHQLKSMNNGTIKNIRKVTS